MVVPATEATMPAIRRVAAASQFTHGFPGRFIAQDIARYLSEGWVGAAVEEGQVVGYVVVRPMKRRPYTNLHWMGVVEGARRHGIGAALIDYAWGRNPHDQIRLHVAEQNAGAIAFYLRHGFEEYGRLHKASGDEILMYAGRPA